MAEVANELNLEKEAAKDQLTAREAVAVVQSNADKPRYRYQPLDPSLRSMVEQLAVGYSKQRVPMLSAILSKHSDRTRLFAEAFGIIRRSD